MKKILSLVLIICLLGSVFVGCAKDDPTPTPPLEPVEIVLIQFEMMDGGKMTFELYPEYAPKTVENFVGLVNDGFYDGLTFHRIVKGFMAQGGDPLGNGTGGSENAIEGEFSSNGFKQNIIAHTKGVISMARTSDPNSATSQFFIMDGTNPSLDGKYAAFGKLIEGEEVLDAIMATPVLKNPANNEMSLPKETVQIKTIIGLE